jgi:hypothetical protein
MSAHARAVLPSILAVALALTGCGGFRAPSTAADSARNSDDLTSEDLADYSTVMEAVQALRPIWLRQRTPLLLSPRSGTEAASPVWVYWDGTRLGDPSHLSRITTSQVSRIVHYDARAASLRWGISHENGVIYLVPTAGAAPPVIK